ncbi:hypothetical protein [uncultured Akkermansia sp.]|uniref:hypothetical protein n=3 Tax=uncultured Akkermansia sp. TaxID=512294 RepID=UPI00261E74A5|nr:hypothetical protein [uncultured Akkermansia sp.]
MPATSFKKQVMACCTILRTPDAWGISSARTVALTSLPNWENSLSRPTLNRPHGMPKRRTKRFFLSVQEESTFRPQHRTSVTHQCFPLTNFPVLPAVMNDGSFIIGKFGQKTRGLCFIFPGKHIRQIQNFISHFLQVNEKQAVLFGEKHPFHHRKTAFSKMADKPYPTLSTVLATSGLSIR